MSCKNLMAKFSRRWSELVSNLDPIRQGGHFAFSLPAVLPRQLSSLMEDAIRAALPKGFSAEPEFQGALEGKKQSHRQITQDSSKDYVLWSTLTMHICVKVSAKSLRDKTFFSQQRNLFHFGQFGVLQLNFIKRQILKCFCWGKIYMQCDPQSISI